MKRALSYLYICAGILLACSAYGCIIIPQGIISGGATGLARLITSYSGITVSITTAIVNAVIFILGYIFIGKEFIFKTALASVFFPVLLEVTTRIRIFDPLAADPLLSCVLAGVMLGLAAAFVIKGEGSTAGFDVIGIILKKKLGIEIALVTGVMDAAVLILQSLHSDMLQIVYGLLVIVITSFVLKYALVAGHGETQIMIISEQYETIRRELYDRLNVGQTLLRAEMGYTEKATNVILVVTFYNNLPDVKKVIREIDPQAFVIVSDVKSVIGRGYTFPRYDA